MQYINQLTIIDNYIRLCNKLDTILIKILLVLYV